MSDQVYVLDEETKQKAWVAAAFLTHPDYEGRFTEIDPECDCPKGSASSEGEAIEGRHARPAGNAATKTWYEYVTAAPSEGGLGLEADPDSSRDQLVAIADEYEAGQSTGDEETD